MMFRKTVDKRPQLRHGRGLVLVLLPLLRTSEIWGRAQPWHVMVSVVLRRGTQHTLLESCQGKDGEFWGHKANRADLGKQGHSTQPCALLLHCGARVSHGSRCSLVDLTDSPGSSQDLPVSSWGHGHTLPHLASYMDNEDPNPGSHAWAANT